MTRRIIITEQQLKTIMESNEERIEISLDNIPSDFPFDISLWTKETLKRQYREFKPQSSSTNIEESQNDVNKQNLEMLKEKFTKEYGILPDQFNIGNLVNDIYISILVPDIKMNKNIIEREMEKIGFFLSSEKEFEIEQTSWTEMDFEIRNMQKISLKYEPYLQDDVYEKYAKFNFYHITYTSNVGNIMKYGLVPRHENKEFIYPDRVYLIKGDFFDEATDQQRNIRLGRILSSFVRKNPSVTDFTILRIDLSKMDRPIQLFEDPNMHSGLFTNDTIPPKAIVWKQRL